MNSFENVPNLGTNIHLRIIDNQTVELLDPVFEIIPALSLKIEEESQALCRRLSGIFHFGIELI